MEVEQEDPWSPERQRELDDALRSLLALEEKRALWPHEQVRKGQLMLLASEGFDYRPEDARKAYESALEADPDHVDALLEMGWHFYVHEDEAGKAQAYFDRALAILQEFITEAISGRVACIEELSSEEAARAEYQRLTAERAHIVRRRLSVDLQEWFPE